jgi:branched-subunit amino acid aminotransferase/4-amino-4-deoxychorismate lyase
MCAGEIFRLGDHTRRLFRYAEILDFEIAYRLAEIDEARKATRRRRAVPHPPLARLGPPLICG